MTSTIPRVIKESRNGPTRRISTRLVGFWVPFFVIAVVAFSDSSVEAAFFKFVPMNHGRRSPEKSTKPKEPKEPKVVPIGHEELRMRVEAIVAESDGKLVGPGERELLRLKPTLYKSCQDFLTQVEKIDLRGTGAIKEKYSLDDLQAALKAEGLPDTRALLKTYNAISSDNDSLVPLLLLAPLRAELRRYLTIELTSREADFQGRFEQVCGDLMKAVERYAENGNPVDAVDIADASLWLEDLGTFEPRMKEIAALMQTAFSGPNIFIEVRRPVVSAFFERVFEQQFEVRERILGSDVRGSGTATGKTTAVTVPNKNAVEICLIIESDTVSKTTARQQMVTVFTENRGPVNGEKSIRISPERFTTLPAKCVADTRAKITGTRVNAGPFIRCIAEQQVQARKAASEAEGRRLTAKRLGERIDAEADPQIAEFERKFRESVQKPIAETGLGTKRWNFSSSDAAVFCEIALKNRMQPTVFAPPSEISPEISNEAGIIVRVHHSALNNLAKCVLSGRTINEEKFIADIEDRFGPIERNIDRKANEAPLVLEFAKKAPIGVTFDNQKIVVEVKLDRIEQSEFSRSRYPMDIRVEYEIETAETLRLRLKEIKVQPPGFAPERGDTVSARMEVIRTVLVSRLREALPESIELEGRELPGRKLDDGTETPGPGRIKPILFETKDGWLSIVWKFEKNELEHYTSFR